MTKTQTIAAVSSLLLMMGVSIWIFYASRGSHEILIAPVQQGAQR